MKVWTSEGYVEIQVPYITPKDKKFQLRVNYFIKDLETLNKNNCSRCNDEYYSLNNEALCNYCKINYRRIGKNSFIRKRIG
jgi:hypothetical protein